MPREAQQLFLTTPLPKMVEQCIRDARRIPLVPWDTSYQESVQHLLQYRAFLKTSQDPTAATEGTLDAYGQTDS
jgi:hypothetical protein